MADTLRMKWSNVNHISGVEQGKSASQKTDVLETEPRFLCHSVAVITMNFELLTTNA